jgi:hypothetical protein
MILLNHSIVNIGKTIVKPLLTQVYVKVCILLIFGKYLHHRILSLSVGVWARRTIPHFIEIPVQSQKWSIMCLMDIDSISVIFLLY